MLNTLYQSLVALGAAIAFGLGMWVARLRHRIQYDAAERDAAQHEQIERAAEQLEATRRKYNNQAPVDPERRTDFE